MSEMNDEAIRRVADKLQEGLTLGQSRGVLIDAGDGIFVQFCIDPERSENDTFDGQSVLWLDMPCKALKTPEQSERAARFFSERGVEGPTEERARNVKNDGWHMLAVWKLNLGRDCERAARLGFNAMKFIFDTREVRRITMRCVDAEED